jgi:hypothetical protein
LRDTGSISAHLQFEVLQIVDILQPTLQNENVPNDMAETDLIFEIMTFFQFSL